VDAPFAGNKMNLTIRCALLAGTMLAALPASGQAFSGHTVAGPLALSTERPIMLAQAPAIDPQTGKPLPKGVAPKGPPAAQTPPAPPKQVQPIAPPVLPKQVQPVAPPAPPKQVQPTAPPVLPKQVQQPAPPTPPALNTQGPPPGAPQIKGLPKQIQQNTQQQQPQQPPPAGLQPVPKGIQQGAPQPPAGGVAPVQQLGQPPQGLPKQIQQGGQPPLQPPAGGLQPPQPAIQQVAPAIQPIPGQQPQLGQPQGGPPQVVQPLRGNVDQLRGQRQERRDAAGVVVIEEPGRRMIVREGNTVIIRHDETERFRRWGGEPVLERRGAEPFAVVPRPGGYQIVTVTDPNGRLLRRMRRGPDGREVILLENRHYGPGPGLGAVGVGVGVGLAAGVLLGLAAPVLTLPRERYIVDVSAAPAPLLYETLEAPPLVAIERPYSNDEIRYNVELRDRMRRIDIDSVTFDSGSWEVTPEQQPKLAVVADALRRVLARHPDEMFMIEGHTDATGNDVDNLSLSDRRAESVAVILTDGYQFPPENLVTQGYGSQHMKIPSDGPLRENRRVTIRRITPLLNGGVAAR
jgi:outer membrane protein OmpA-like peptidoglycan-associated protein